MMLILSAAVGLMAAQPAPGAQAETPHPLSPVALGQVKIDDAFWAPRLKVFREVTIPDCFAKFEHDGALTNFDAVRDGKGEHHGPPWLDGLLYEMIRASADFLATQRDAALETRLDGYIEHIAAAAAKDPDGYLNTYTQLAEPAHRWGRNGGDDHWQHDLYNAGCLVEAGVHYYRATGRTRLLEVAVKLANHMAAVMGPAPRWNVVPGHSLGEEALVGLYRLFREQPELRARMPVPVDESRYLQLAEFWIETRGHFEGRKSFGRVAQDEVPVLGSTTIEGHAVRATLLGAGLVAAGSADNRADYLATAQRLWDNMVHRRMYVTGGLGAVAGYEGFGPDYVLPNDGYVETCAAVGAGFFHHNLNLAFADARYADELERVLYNGVLAGISLAGDSYFYQNPLDAGRDHVRWAWHGCPCCPPMLLKIYGALPGYVYAQDADGVYVNLYVGSQAHLALGHTRVALRQATRYPWDGEIELTVTPEQAAEFELRLRLPEWCAAPRLSVNGHSVGQIERVRGYARLRRQWQPGDRINLTLPMPVERLHANPRVAADQGRVALQRGPLVYCVEALDHGGRVRNLVLPPEAPLRVRHRPDLFGGIDTLEGTALALEQPAWPDTLYQPGKGGAAGKPITLCAIPYYANANRQPSEMAVWLADNPAQAVPLAPATLATGAHSSALHCWEHDSVAALNDQIEPTASDDQAIPRFTWWDHRGTAEWVQYTFDQPRRASSVEVYWWDERRIQAHCRVPQSWRITYQAEDGSWRPVTAASGYPTEMDQFCRVDFEPVTTRALRLEVQLQPEWSGGILEWRVR